MGALTPRRRTGDKTAREIAAEVGLSERTIVGLIAEPRADFEGRARRRRAAVIRLRLQGCSYREIAAHTGDTPAIAGRLLADARRNGEWAEAVARHTAHSSDGE